MNVSDLKKMLENYPDDMEIITVRYSDYEVILPDHCSVIKGVYNPSGWVMESHRSMSDDNKLKEKEYLALAGS